MKKVNKIFSIFIIILLICFMISTPVFAIDVSDTERYNQFSQGSKDKAADNVLTDLGKIKTEEDFINAKGTSSIANTMKGALEKSSYYLIAEALMSDPNYVRYDENNKKVHYSLEQMIELKKGSTYKEIYEDYPALASMEKRDSNDKVDWSRVQTAYDKVNTLTSWASSLKDKEDVTETDEDTLKAYEWTEIMEKYSTAPTLIEQGKISVVKSWLSTLQEVEADPLDEKWDFKNSGYDLQQVRDAISYLKGVIEDAEAGSTVYKAPKKTSQAETSEASIEDVINDGDTFVNSGNASEAYDATQLQNFSKTIYNILLVAGILVATAMGGILGIKLMTSSVEEKAEVKKLLVPYVVGCVVVFGGFGIWKLVVTILERI